MGKHDVCEGRRVNGKRPVFFIGFFAAALKHSAVEQNTIIPGFDKMHGTRHFPNCAVKCDLHFSCPFLGYKYFSFSRQKEIFKDKICLYRIISQRRNSKQRCKYNLRIKKNPLHHFFSLNFF
jgi:hypothetical protein